MSENNFIVTVEEDDNGDLLLPFPPEFVLKMGWTEDTEFECEITDDLRIILREKK